MLSCADFLAEFGDYIDDTASSDLRAHLECRNVPHPPENDLNRPSQTCPPSNFVHPYGPAPVLPSTDRARRSRVTVSEHDQERLQALESELSNTKAELARVARVQALAA